MGRPVPRPAAPDRRSACPTIGQSTFPFARRAVTGWWGQYGRSDGHWLSRAGNLSPPNCLFVARCTCAPPWRSAPTTVTYSALPVTSPIPSSWWTGTGVTVLLRGSPVGGGPGQTNRPSPSHLVAFRSACASYPDAPPQLSANRWQHLGGTPSCPRSVTRGKGPWYCMSRVGPRGSGIGWRELPGSR